MKKYPVRWTALALALAASLTILPVGAVSATAAPPTEAAQAINALGIMVGNANGDMMLSSKVTRAEFITMALKATPNGDQVGQASTSPYPDVPYTHWAAGYVEAGVRAGLISGYSDGTFRPGNPITLAEGATIVLSLLGYTPEDFSGAYPTPQMALYHSLGLDKGVKAQGANTVLTRYDAMYLFYNMLPVKTKAGTPYLTTLGHTLNAAGEVDLVSIINGEMEGPVVAVDNWKEKIPFDLTGVKVNRDGAAASLDRIQSNDVVYWCAPMRTLWAYSDQITGTIQELTPTSSAPTSVVVAGRTYPIETSTAALALSDLGQFKLGDVVTLLLGRDGGVAAVSAPLKNSGQRYGVVVKTEKAPYTDGPNSTYTSDTITLLATDGNTYRYAWKNDQFRVGDVVGVTLDADGGVTLKHLNTSSISGTVSSDGKQLGKTPLAPDVEILDVFEQTGAHVYPSRLAGVSLSADDVRYYTLNSSGEIDRLILQDVTGDMHHYGVLTKLESMGDPASMGSAFSYEYDLGGTPGALAMSSTRYPVEKGPIVIKGDVSAPSKMTSLHAVKATRVSGNQMYAGDQSYTIADGAPVYEYRGGNYYLTSLERLSGTEKTITGWYDKDQRSGGRIRVLVAQ